MTMPHTTTPVSARSPWTRWATPNGSVLAMDPSTGRILTIVNQKMAFSSGFEPCSTIKPVIALAGLQEGVITRDTMLKVGHRRYMDLTEAMAHSNNVYFERWARASASHGSSIRATGRLGPARRLRHSGRAARFRAPRASAYGGVARMSSFGEGIRITPLQLASLAATLANGGTEVLLAISAHGRTRQNFQPRVRRHWISLRCFPICAKACSPR